MNDLKCPICQSTCFEDESEQTSRCLDCFTVIDSGTFEVLQVN